MARTKQNVSHPSFVADPHSMINYPGGHVDWSAVTADADGKKRLKAGQPVAFSANGLVPRDGTNAADGLLATNAEEGATQDALTGYGVYAGGIVYEELLPVTLDATTKTELGDSFKYVTYSNSQVS